MHLLFPCHLFMSVQVDCLLTFILPGRRLPFSSWQHEKNNNQPDACQHHWQLMEVYPQLHLLTPCFPSTSSCPLGVRGEGPATLQHLLVAAAWFFNKFYLEACLPQLPSFCPANVLLPLRRAPGGHRLVSFIFIYPWCFFQLTMRGK